VRARAANSAAQRERLDRCLFESGCWRGHEAPREVREAYERRCAVGLNRRAGPHAPWKPRRVRP